MYKLFKSEDMGITYELVLADKDTTKFADYINEFESQSLRWAVEKDDELHSACRYLVDLIHDALLHKKEASDDNFVVATDDLMITKVLKSRGVKVLNTVELFKKINEEGVSIPGSIHSDDEVSERINDLIGDVERQYRIPLEYLH